MSHLLDHLRIELLLLVAAHRVICSCVPLAFLDHLQQNMIVYHYGKPTYTFLEFLIHWRHRSAATTILSLNDYFVFVLRIWVVAHGTHCVVVIIA